MASLTEWLRRLLGLDVDATALIPAGDRASEERLVMVVSESSASLAAMYADVLRKAGIPVLAREWGGGSALVGGVPVGVSLYVPTERADEARLALGVERENTDDEGGQTLEG